MATEENKNHNNATGLESFDIYYPFSEDCKLINNSGLSLHLCQILSVPLLVVKNENQRK